MKTIVRLIGLLTLIFFSSASMFAQDSSSYWPREINTSEGKMIVYQPQPETMKDNLVTGVWAFSITPNGKTEPVFGAMFFEATINIDKDTRLYVLQSLEIPNIKLSTDESLVNADKLKASVEDASRNSNFTGNLDELIATVEKKQNAKSREKFKNDPPKIILEKTSSVLILIDGEPKLEEIEKSGIKRVVNTPYVILQSGSDKQYYLYGGDAWYKSGSIKSSSWATTRQLPSDIKKLMDQNKDKIQQQTEQANKTQSNETKSTTPPKVIISTEPAELIQTQGEPNFITIEGTELLYVKNSEDEIFRDLGSQKYYILKSGRWYASTSLEGNWKFIEPEELPKTFSNIPNGHEVDGVLASVPETVESKDALLDAQVPQTATVDRKTAGKDVAVEYEGKSPKMEPVQGTSMQYAVNTSSTVMKDDKKYYLVENGVWYESYSSGGPWQVSTHRPSQVENIEPSSPVYNTKYVYIYDYTPDVVYVGYTPGYMGSYIYGPTVVYGTGYYYNPWYGSYYYPRPVTWGFNMHYNPWTGWSVGFGFSSGPWHFGFSTGGYYGGWYGGWGGWWGPPMYRPPVCPPHYPWYGYNRPGYGRPGYGGGNNVNIGGGNQINIGGDLIINTGSGNNIYNKNPRDKSNKMGVSSGIKDNKAVNVGTRPATPSTRPSTGTGATTRPGTSTPSTRPSTTPSTRPATGGQTPSTRPSTGGQTPSTRPSTGGQTPSTRPSNNVYADNDGNVYRKDAQGNWDKNQNGKWNKADQSTPNWNNTRPTMDNRDYDRNRGSNKVSQPPKYNRPTTPTTRPASRPTSRPSSGGAARRF
jgi:hypothetical protein